MTREELDAALIAAHAAGDGASVAALYLTAGNQAEADGDTDAACFFWVNSFVFALEAGIPLAEEARAQLVRFGREE